MTLSRCSFSSEPSIPKYWSQKKQEAHAEQYHRKLARIQSITRYRKDCSAQEDTTYLGRLLQLFDTEGRIIEQRRFSTPNQLLGHAEYVYDSVGHLISIKHYNLYNELSEIEQFDEHGYRRLWLRFRERGRLEKKTTEMTYNEAQYAQSSQTHDEADRLVSETTYSYYEDNVLKEVVEKMYYTRVPHLGERKRIRRSYNTEGRLTESYTATPRDTILLRYTYKLNPHDLPEVTEEQNEHGLTTRTLYTYSSEHHLQRKQQLFFSPLGKERLRAVTLYNNQQKPTLIIHTDSRGQEILRETFRYNVKGLLSAHQKRTPKEELCFSYVYSFYPTP